MTSRHWLLFAFIAVLLVAGALLVVAVSNRAAEDAAPASDAESEAVSSSDSVAA